MPLRHQWDRLTRKFEGVHFGKVNIDTPAGMELAQELGVLEEGLPHVKLFAGKLRSTTSCGGEHPPCERPGLMFSRSRYGYAVLTVGRDGFEVDFKDITGASLFGWSRTAE